MTLPDNNEGLKRRMAWYVLSLGAAIQEMDGPGALEERIKLATKKVAELKATELMLIAEDQRYIALANRLCVMLENFSGGNIHVSASDEGAAKTVNNPVCPCLPPFVTEAESFGFKPEEVRKYACMICMGSYSVGAKLTGVRFAGKLTTDGCMMNFSLRPK